MKTLTINTNRTENTQFEVLTREEMNAVKGGGQGSIIFERL